MTSITFNGRSGVVCGHSSFVRNDGSCDGPQAVTNPQTRRKSETANRERSDRRDSQKFAYWKASRIAARPTSTFSNESGGVEGHAARVSLAVDASLGTSASEPSSRQLPRAATKGQSRYQARPALTPTPTEASA